MGSDFSCTPQDDEQHSIHAAAYPGKSALFTQSTLRVIGSETSLYEAYIPLQFTPSPSPNVAKRCIKRSRLPKKQTRKLEPVISGESWDSFGEGNAQCRQLRQLVGANTFVKQETITRCVSDRQRYLRVKAVGKRSSVPVELLQKQLAQFEQRSSLPLFIRVTSEDSDGVNVEGSPADITRRSTDRSDMSTPMSDVWMMESTRSRPGWASVSAEEKSYGSFGVWHEDNNTMRRRINEILRVENSDSQFQMTAPVLTPIFSNKVMRFANEDEERCSMIVDALEQTLHTLPHMSSSSSDSGSPLSHIMIGGTSFPATPVLRRENARRSTSAFPPIPVLRKDRSSGRSTSAFPPIPVLRKDRSSGTSSIGGGLLSPTPDLPAAGWKVAVSLERTRKLASKIQHSPELLEKMAKELEDLSMKYAKMMRNPSSHSPVIIC